MTATLAKLPPLHRDANTNGPNDAANGNSLARARVGDVQIVDFRPHGRPSPHRDARQIDGKTKFIAALERGLSIGGAARRAGLSRATVYAWAERDVEFARAWREARNAGLDAIEDSILAASLKDWRAALAILRTFRPQWRHRCPGCEQREAESRSATAKASSSVGREAPEQNVQDWLRAITEEGDAE